MSQHVVDTFSAFDKLNESPVSIYSSGIKTTQHHPGLELDDDGMTYKIKKGYVLPITATQYKPNRFFGHGIEKLTGHLPEGSTFTCYTKDCSQILSSYDPIISDTKDNGICFGQGCIANDWRGFDKKKMDLQ